ncbi:hypothetical protein F5146DRAFT_1221097 [Armillaria mellea]|nr:hypothetical protein F5146DRAFT_1221097 [Armillaria mellea]
MIAQHKEDLYTLDLQVTNLKNYKQYLLDQVTHVDGIIEELRQQHERACSAIQEKQTILSPVRRLPSEVLSEISLQMVDFPIQRVLAGQESPYWSFTSVHNTLASIELVSRHWRQTVLSVPQLWSYGSRFAVASYIYSHCASTVPRRRNQKSRVCRCP